MDTLQLNVIRIDTVATNAVIIYLEAGNHLSIKYEAGQFLTFLFNNSGRDIRRSYSIVSTPGIEKELAIVVKRHVNGEISRRLVDHLKPGDVLTSLLPAGRFTISTDHMNKRPVFFIAAGSGISPIFSLIKKLLYLETFSKVILIYQNRDEASIIFNKELQALHLYFPERLVCINLLSNPLRKKYSPQRLNNELLEQLVTRYYESGSCGAFYICGPVNFMRMTQFVLKTLGIHDDNIRKENFVVDFLPPSPPLITDSSPKQIILRWKGNAFRFTAAYPVNILQAALDHNIQLPYSCRGGRCSTCTVRCVSGKVKMAINEVLTEKDMLQGLILTCVGYAETDVELEV